MSVIERTLPETPAKPKTTLSPRGRRVSQTPPAPEPRIDWDARIMEAAIEYLQEHGWCRGHYYRGDGRVCLVGAIAQGAGEGGPSGVDWSDRYPGIRRRVEKAIRHKAIKPLPRDAKKAESWNDLVCRNGRQAIGVLRQAIKEPPMD